MRISTVANFFFRRLLSKNRSVFEAPAPSDPPLLCEDIQFAAPTETLQALSEDYHLLKERIGALEDLQKLLFVDPTADISWPETPLLRVKEPHMQALLEYVELRALIFQEQLRSQEKADKFS